MKSSLRGKGFKPAVAFANQRAAVANIDLKMKVLSSLLRLADKSTLKLEAVELRERQLAAMPSTVRQFNSWDSKALDQLGFKEAFHSNAQITLKQSGRYDKVQLLVQAAKQLQSRSPPEQRRADSLAALRRRIRLSNQLRLIAERELLDQKRENVKLEKELESLQKRLDSLARETGLSTARAAARIKELEGLVQQRPSKVVALPPRKRPKGR